MKKIIKVIYAAFALLTLTMGAVTSHGALNDLFASIGGNGDNGGGFVYQYTPIGVQSLCMLLAYPGLAAWVSITGIICSWQPTRFTAFLRPFREAILKITPDGMQSYFCHLKQ